MFSTTDTPPCVVKVWITNEVADFQNKLSFVEKNFGSLSSNVTICDDLSIVRYDLPQRKGWTLDDFASSKNPLYLYLLYLSTHIRQFIYYPSTTEKKLLLLNWKMIKLEAVKYEFIAKLEHPELIRSVAN